MSDILTLSDFAGQLNLEGFGQSDMSTVDELNKALGTGTTGEAYGSYADGSALRPESLEGTLKVVVAGEKHVKLWKDIDKLPAYNTVEEYNVLESYGGETSAFFVEGGLPEEEDSIYSRKTALVKFLGTTRVITHPMTLVKTAHGGDIVSREAHNGTVWLMHQMERALFFGDSALNPLAFDGIGKQITAGNGHIIDMKGAPLSEKVCEDASGMIIDSYGMPSKMYLTPQAHRELSNIMFPRQKVPFSAPNDGYIGVPLRGFQSNGGTWGFEPDIFLRPRGEAPATGKDGAPSTPEWDDTTPLAAGASSTGVGLPAGTYSYQVTAVNAKGESAATEVSAVAAEANQQVTIKFGRVNSGNVAKSYRIYRNNGSGKALFMVEIADPGTGTDVTYVDRNQDIPGTSQAFLLDLNGEQSLRFKQLAPLMKLPLARISAAERFMILLYGMPIMYNPKRSVLIKNIGAYQELST
jgi:hypothetical protein